MSHRDAAYITESICSFTNWKLAKKTEKLEIQYRPFWVARYSDANENFYICTLKNNKDNSHYNTDYEAHTFKQYKLVET